jgi:hypothetical protein
MLTLLGTLIALTFTAWLSTRSVHAMIAEVQGELKLDILRIENKLDHFAETQASHSERIDRLERR